MSQMIESMESRLLFIASAGVILADLSAAKSQVGLGKADLKLAVSLATADTKGLKATVVAAHPTVAQKKVLSTLQKHELVAVAKYKKTVTTILTHGDRDGEHLLAVLESLRKHPKSIVIQTKVQLALSAVQGVFSDSVLASVQASASSTVTGLDTDLNALAAAVPSTQTGVTAFEAHLTTDLTTLATQGAAIQAAIAKVAVDLA